MGHQICEWGCGPLATGPGPVGFDLDSADFSGGPVVEAAPGPIFGPLDEAALDRIAMDVLELLDEFGLGETLKS